MAVSRELPVVIFHVFHDRVDDCLRINFEVGVDFNKHTTLRQSELTFTPVSKLYNTLLFFCFIFCTSYYRDFPDVSPRLG